MVATVQELPGEPFQDDVVVRHVCNSWWDMLYTYMVMYTYMAIELYQFIHHG